MCVQELIVSYLNRFVILFNQNATAKLEFSCGEGKVTVNIFHELGAIKQPLPPTPLVKKVGYDEVLKKNLKAAQAAGQSLPRSSSTNRQNSPLEELTLTVWVWPRRKAVEGKG